MSALDRWRAGQPLTRPESLAVAEHLMQRGYAAYSNPRHIEHAAISAEVQELMKAGAPGHLGAGGELADGPPDKGMFR